MVNEWPIYPLDSCMDAIIDYRGKTPNKTPSGVPLITAKIVKNGRILPVQEFIAESEYDVWMRRGMPKNGDVLITTEAPLGEVAQLDGRKVALAQRIITLRGRNGFLDNRFLKYLLQSPTIQQQINGRASGTTVSGIKQSELRKVLLPIPPFSEQHAIAHILGSLDDKIELNRKMNETLEGIAQALFKNWFVDFDPVRAKMEGRQPEGLSLEIAALFPDKLVDSPLGMIPEGWEVQPLSELIMLNPAEKIAKGVKAPYLDMAALPTKGFFVAEARLREMTSGSRFRNGDTLLARITPCLENGKTGYVTELLTGQIGWGSTEFIVMRPKFPLPSEFGYLLAREQGFRNFVIRSMTGSSGRQRAPTEALARYELINPTEKICLVFGDLIKPLFAKTTELMREVSALSCIRDELLPKLISGELRVKDALSSFSEVL